MFAALFVSVALIVLVTVGPLWDQVKEFLNEVPAYWEEISSSDAFQTFVSSGSQDDVRSALEDLAKGLPDAATTLLGVAGGVFGSLLSLGDADLPLAVHVDRAPHDHRWGFRLRAT